MNLFKTGTCLGHLLGGKYSSTRTFTSGFQKVDVLGFPAMLGFQEAMDILWLPQHFAERNRCPDRSWCCFWSLLSSDLATRSHQSWSICSPRSTIYQMLPVLASSIDMALSQRVWFFSIPLGYWPKVFCNFSSRSHIWNIENLVMYLSSSQVWGTK